MSPGSTSVPPLFVDTTSTRPPDAYATTGVALSCASTATSPSPSSRDGNCNHGCALIHRHELRLRECAEPLHAIGDLKRKCLRLERSFIGAITNNFERDGVVGHLCKGIEQIGNTFLRIETPDEKNSRALCTMRVAQRKPTCQLALAQLEPRLPERIAWRCRLTSAKPR